MKRGCSQLRVFTMIEVFIGEWLFLGERTEEILITNVYAFPMQVQEVLVFGESKYPLTQVLGAYYS